MPVDIIAELGLYHGIMTSFSFITLLGVLTWLVFYYWDWIRHDSNQWEFRQSIPELEHAIKTYTSENIQIERSEGFDPTFRSPEDSLRIDLLFAKLERMNLSYTPGESRTEYLTNILDYARNKTYKGCQYLEIPF